MSRLIVLTLAVCCVFSAAAQPAKTKRFVEETKRAVSDQFKDPDSVKFRDLAVFQKYESSVEYLCGQVNAKNAYGAYVGYVDFFAAGGIVTLSEGGDDRVFHIYQREACHKKLSEAK